MAIEVIVELQARPGKRDELGSLLESVAAKSGPSAPGFLGSTRYDVLESGFRSPGSPDRALRKKDRARAGSSTV